ncbi:hypothetical protein [Brevundimonas sp.]|uniref:hypothetical protein n=1 Tax=Brevundimonas sp. TaxID=1871086 RepID=UPI0022CCE5D7|nr:hypothetical protein [Brevundimonas sp.]MCZ8193534.1 hypothetical protein [Brevundimonas sp.]
MRPSDRLLGALTIGILTIGLVVVSLCMASMYADVAGEHRQTKASTTYRVTALPPDLLRPLLPEAAESPVLPQELGDTLEASGSLIRASVRVAPARERVGPRLGREAAASDVRLLTVAVDESFPRLFALRSNGQPLTQLDFNGGVWLTRRGLERLGAVTSEVGFVTMGQEVLPVRGVLDDPFPTAHLQYEALVGFDHAFSYANTVLGTTFTYPAHVYVQSEAPQDAVNDEIANALFAVTGLKTETRLTPISEIRNASARQLPFEAEFVQSGRALEAYAAGITAIIGLCAILLSTALLGQAMHEARRHALGVLACLGRRPSRVYAQANGAFLLMLLSAAALAGLAIWTIGPDVFRALGKPRGLEGLEGIVVATLGAVVALLQLAAAAGLLPLLTSRPLTLLGRRPGVRRRALVLSAAGTGLLSAAAAAVFFVAAMFHAEVSVGGALNAASARTWVAMTPEAAGASAVARASPVVAQLRSHPDVQAAGTLHWRPYAGRDLNMSVRRAGGDSGRFVQTTVLTGESFFPALSGAQPVAGELDPGPVADGVCLALIDTQAVTSLGFDHPASALAQRLQIGDFERECQIVGVTEKIRLGKLSTPPSPTIHLIGSEFSTTTSPDGRPTAQVIVVFKPGAPATEQRRVMAQLASPGLTPRTISDLGARAYTRESRMAGLLASSALALGATLVCVCLALAANAIARQRHAIALRQALGSRTLPLVLSFCAPALAGALIGAALAACAVIVLQPTWRSWGGLSAPIELWQTLLVAAGLLAPVLFTFFTAWWLLNTVRPAEALSTATS